MVLFDTSHIIPQYSVLMAQWAPVFYLSNLLNG